MVHKANITKAMENLNKDISCVTGTAITFDAFLKEMVEKPRIVIRNVFQTFNDFIYFYLGDGIDEYPEDPESIHYVYYDCSKLFVEGSDRPFFADRLFANKLVNLARSIKKGSKQNQIYIFNGPPGCGKSTFLNNLLSRFEEYTKKPEGLRYETLWRIRPDLLGENITNSNNAVEKLACILSQYLNKEEIKDLDISCSNDGFIEIPCPSHDNPLMLIPRKNRIKFLQDLFNGSDSASMLTDKEYEWLFKEDSCTICSCLYQAILDKVNDVNIVHSMIYARPYQFNRRIGEGISIFNPGDPPLPQKAISDQRIQQQLNKIFNSKISYTYSRYAKTNNGVFAIMDVKSHNTQRLIWLHNIISEGVHKVGDLEENVNSMFLTVMNPEDQENINDFKSFTDRIEYIRVPYVLDAKTEAAIYHNTFGADIEDKFLPRVLNNFARVVIATRLNKKSASLDDLIDNYDAYSLFCDKNYLLLKMDLYSGDIPSWLSQYHRKRLTAKVRRQVIDEAENEGMTGISGRDSIKLFSEFYTKYAKEGTPINMSMLYNYFASIRREILLNMVPTGFLDSLVQSYDYMALQDVKESLYDYNEKRISRDIQNYIFAVNYDMGSTQVCGYTGEKLEINESFFTGIEKRLIGEGEDRENIERIRKEVQKEYASTTLTQEIMLEKKVLTETQLYHVLLDRYVYNIKERVLDPLIENANFRRAIKDHGTKEFQSYDKKIKQNVNMLMKQLQKKCGYTKRGAKDICVYVIDKNLALKYQMD